MSTKPDTKAEETKPDTKAEETKPDTFTLADVQAQIDAMLANAKEQAEKIVADAKAAVSGEIGEEQKKAKAERDAYWNELVEVYLFKDNGKYKDDVYVSVNGENCVIKRGEPVKVKRKFAEVLSKSNTQDAETSKFMELKQKEFAKSEF